MALSSLSSFIEAEKSSTSMMSRGWNTAMAWAWTANESKPNALAKNKGRSGYRMATWTAEGLTSLTWKTRMSGSQCPMFIWSCSAYFVRNSAFRSASSSLLATRWNRPIGLRTRYSTVASRAASSPSTKAPAPASAAASTERANSERASWIWPTSNERASMAIITIIMNADRTRIVPRREGAPLSSKTPNERERNAGLMCWSPSARRRDRWK